MKTWLLCFILNKHDWQPRSWHGVELSSQCCRCKMTTEDWVCNDCQPERSPQFIIEDSIKFLKDRR